MFLPFCLYTSTFFVITVIAKQSQFYPGDSGYPVDSFQPSHLQIQPLERKSFQLCVSSSFPPKYAFSCHARCVISRWSGKTERKTWFFNSKTSYSVSIYELFQEEKNLKKHRLSFFFCVILETFLNTKIYLMENSIMENSSKKDCF